MRIIFIYVEMVKARIRALTLNESFFLFELYFGRNGKSPYKGIDTLQH